MVRRDILNAIVRTVADEGRTVLFSSHLLDEVEQMSDHVFMIDHGQWVLQGSLDAIKDQHHRLVVQFETQRSDPPSFDGVLSAESTTSGTAPSKTWRLVCCGDPLTIQREITDIGGTIEDTRGVSLEEIFVARVGRDRLAVQEPLQSGSIDRE